MAWTKSARAADKARRPKTRHLPRSGSGRPIDIAAMMCGVNYDHLTRTGETWTTDLGSVTCRKCLAKRPS
jgi:hypothetical protein